MNGRTSSVAIVGVLTFAAALVPATVGSTTTPPATAECVVAVEPNDEAPDAQDLPATAACVTAEHDNATQDVYNWTVGEAEAGQRWTIAVTGIPSQAVTLQVYRVELDESGTVLSSEQLAAADGGAGEGASLANLLWPAGEYVVGVGTSGPGPYELTITAGDPAPGVNDPEPNDAADQAASVAGEFGVAGDRAGSADWFAWELDAAAAAQRWELRLQLPVLSAANLHLTTEDGTEIYSGAVDTTGSLRLVDIGLEPGHYLISVDSATDAVAPYILEAVPGDARAEGQESEPNDTFASGMPVTPVVGSTAIAGRLASVGAETDYDTYRLAVDGDVAGRQMDVKLFWRGGSSRRFCLQDAAGQPLQCGDGVAGVAFNDVVLQAGEYAIVVSGAPAADDPYLLRLDVTDEATSGFEAEPNDTPALASQLDVTGGNPAGSGRLTSQGASADVDSFHFMVSGEPQLWQVTATGPGVTGLETVDAIGATAMSADAAADPGTGVMAATLYDVFLLPGDRGFRVTGSSGDYTIEAEPLGPPDPQAEHEPNNSFDYSQPMRLAESRTGRLVQPDDADVYRFSLQNDGHVVIDAAIAADAQVQMDLVSGNVTLVSLSTAAPGDDVTYDAVLPPGDYALWLSARTPSVEPYELTINAVDPFTTPDDAEPNDAAPAAQPMPADLSVTGTLDATYRYGDADWYIIPAQDAAGTAAFEVSGDTTTIELIVPATADAAETPILPVAGSDLGQYTADLPADTPVLLGVHGQGEYTVTVTPVGGSVVPGSVELPVAVDLAACEQPVAAYWPDSQRIECDVALTNTGDDPIDVSLDAATGHHAWAVDFEATEVSVDAGETATVATTIRVAPDAWADQPVLVTVRAGNDGGAGTGSIAIVPDRLEPPRNPEPYQPLPPELLGGFDVAWSGLGGAPVAVDESAAAEEALLYDQITPVGSGWVSEAGLLPAELTVDLAGDDPVPVAGFTLNPQGGSGLPGDQLRAFELELSQDGATFAPALAGELTRLPVEQAFVLPEPVDARFARLRLLSAQGDTAGYVNLGSFSVIAEPSWSLPTEPDGIDISAPARGGHVVDMRPVNGEYDAWNDVVVADAVRQTLSIDEGQVSWVIGFHQDRAAQLASLTWVDPPDTDPAAQFSSVTVEVSADGPTGPWLPAGTWTLDRAGGAPAPFPFAEPTWARFVRVTVSAPSSAPDPAAVAWELPDAIRVFEQPADDTYRSILGEWGHYRREAIYEQLLPPTEVDLDPDAGNDADAATVLPLGDAVTDTALVGQDEDWYRVQVPAGEEALSVTLTGLPTVDVEVTMFDAEGAEVAVESATTSANATTFTALVDGGGEYLIRVVEPPSSVIFAFDTSMSIGPYTPAVLQGLVRYSGDVEPGQEMVNIIPFGADLLLDEWSDEPYLLQAAITSYPQTATSSDAEGALVTSMTALSAQPGVKAVVLVTDAQNAVNADLWPALEGVQPRIFAVHVAGGFPLDQHLMQDWATVNSGSYSYVRNQGDIDVAFDRAATILRRPSRYSLSVETTEPPAPPTTTSTSTTSTSTTSTSTSTTSTSTTVAPVAVDGFVRVLPAPLQPGQPVAIGGDASVAIILDTSGSMLQDLEGGERIDAARSALTQLVTQTIPAGTNVSLRVFGDTPDSCDTRLLVPQSPLDQAGMASVIENVPVVDGVKTPIGASLAQVAGDLGTAPGPKIVVLVTDGEETCDGDPAAAIQALIDSGIDVRVNIVGFALDDEALKAQFQEWAELGNGQYIDAGNQAELTAAVASAVQPTFDVLHPNGTVIASGQVGGEPVALPAGTYAVEVRSNPPQRFDITIIGGQTLDMPLP